MVVRHTRIRFFALGVLLSALATPCWGQPSRDPIGYPFLYHLDVGQGDATLVVSPQGRTLLIDAGNNGKGTSEAVPVLQQLGISQLDYIIASHYDADHIGGVDEVLTVTGGVAVAAHDRGDPERDRTTHTYRDYVAALGDKLRRIEPGDPIDLGSRVKVRCVAVAGRVTGVEEGVSLAQRDENGASVALVIRYGDFDYFTGGDLTSGGRSGSRRTKDLERLVAPQIGDMDVLKASHHGSLTSSNALFLAAVQPEVAVISVGNGGSNRARYHHPNWDLLDRLLALPGPRALFQTRRGENRGGLSDAEEGRIRVARGDVVISTDGRSYVVNGNVLSTDGAGLHAGAPADTD